MLLHIEFVLLSVLTINRNLCVSSALRDFKVVIRRTDAAERCGLKGHYLLRTDFESLLLKELKSGEVHFTWPYRFLRRFGRDKV